MKNNVLNTVLISGLLLASVVLISLTGKLGEKTLPNVVLVITDDQGYSDIFIIPS